LPFQRGSIGENAIGSIRWPIFEEPFIGARISQLGDVMVSAIIFFMIFAVFDVPLIACRRSQMYKLMFSIFIFAVSLQKYCFHTGDQLQRYCASDFV